MHQLFDVPPTFMWTDSSTVLQWLASADKQPVFVANRVAEILETTTIDQRFHVPTANTLQTLERASPLQQLFEVIAGLKSLFSLEHPTDRVNRNHLPFTLLNQRKRVQLTNYSPTRWHHCQRLTFPS